MIVINKSKWQSHVFPDGNSIAGGDCMMQSIRNFNSFTGIYTRANALRSKNM